MCNTRQYPATHCNRRVYNVMLQVRLCCSPPGVLSEIYFVLMCNTLQHTATHCNILQHTACHVLQHTDTLQQNENSVSIMSRRSCDYFFNNRFFIDVQHTATYCNTLPATCCNAWPRTATDCNRRVCNILPQPRQFCSSPGVLLEIDFSWTATHCHILQHTVTHCNTLQHTAAHCNTCHILPHLATCCNTQPHTATPCHVLQPTPTHCNTLTRTAAHTHTLQHTARHCNTLPHTATL